ncbi:hypothetical protein IFM51744_02556 [Aspergillus udagawae]|nr:hypothetical protein IFM51744_02556 [Aspergillus udagawae]
MAAPESKTLTASCHCGNANFSLTIPKGDLPLKVHVCHCSICRQTHGALCSFHSHVPSGVEPQFIAPSRLEKLTGYAHPYSESTRYFCTNCGCHIGDRSHDDGDWYISVSVFDANANEGMWEIGSHAFTNSTRDGGMSELIPQIRGQMIKVWNPQERPASEELPVVPASEDDQLLAQCHCGGVSMTISRPHRDYLVGPAGRKWVHPSDMSKWLALVDVCRDCRLLTGTHAIAWILVPTDHISPSLPEDLLIGSLKSYVSSEGTLGSFCGTCGATVFRRHTSQPGIVGIAMGLLRASEGVMASDWACWRMTKLENSDEGMKYDEGFTKGLEKGLVDWRTRKYGNMQDLAVELQDYELWCGH